MRRDVVASCRDLVKTYWKQSGQVRALQGIDADFFGGALTAVVGPSGSGKSSLLRLLAALDRPTAGVVRIGDTEIGSASGSELREVRRKRVGYVFQRPSDNFVPYLTVMQHLDLAHRDSGGVSDIEPSELLDDLGIGHRGDHHPNELSGGEQQRAALAQILVAGPRIIVADEPTAELDSHSAREVLTIMKRLSADGISLILATHDSNVSRVADESLELHHGVLGTPSTPAHVIVEEPADTPVSGDDPDAAWRRPGTSRLDPPRGGRVVQAPDRHLAGSTPVPQARLLEVRNVVKSYRRGNETVHALQHVDLVLEPHRLIGLVGRSGSGKTTLLNILAGWEHPDEGRFEWDEEPSSRTLTPWTDVSVVPQKLGLIEELTVRENIEYPARLTDRLEALGPEVDRLVASLGLEQLLERYPLETSVGEQQRTALARALVLTPRLLLADEPTGHQDSRSAHKVFQALRHAAERGTCCLVATHNEEVIGYLDEVITMSDGILHSAGELLADGSTRQA
ncbi:MAG: ABC transporter ATP-binding protein [Actinomycetota bacterium]|nr:ABC transporter ATP-binding protein [Actinomycetota bacterium]